jgi:hypothetical protein
LSISIARAQAAAPFPLAMTTALGLDWADAGRSAEDKAAVVTIQSRLVMLVLPSVPEDCMSILRRLLDD